MHPSPYFTDASPSPLLSPRKGRLRRCRCLRHRSRHRTLCHRRGSLELGIGHLCASEVRVEVAVEVMVIEVGPRVGWLRDRRSLCVLRPGDSEAAVWVERLGPRATRPGAAAAADDTEGVVCAVDARVRKDGVSRLIIYGRHSV